MSQHLHCQGDAISYTLVSLFKGLDIIDQIWHTFHVDGAKVLSTKSASLNSEA